MGRIFKFFKMTNTFVTNFILLRNSYCHKGKNEKKNLKGAYLDLTFSIIENF